MNKKILSLLLFSFASQSFAFTTEDFETETAGSPSFTDNGLTFTVTGAVDNYNIWEQGFFDGNGAASDSCPGSCGWNGTSADTKFLDNTGVPNGNLIAAGDGSSFSIVTTGNFFVQSLYLFCATSTITTHTGTVTITGMRNGMVIYTIFKDSGFSNVVTFTPSNGFTLFDFATDGMADYTDDPIDTLIISSTGNLDYMALDGFTWEPTALPVELQSFSIE